MIKTLPLLFVFAFNAFAQCARTENSQYYPANYAVFFPCAQIECVVFDKPDYFAPVSDENDPAAPASAVHACALDISSVHMALFERYNAFCKTIMARQSNAYLDGRRCILIAYVKAPHVDSPEDVPLIVS
jgi:hypothetical protein